MCVCGKTSHSYFLENHILFLSTTSTSSKKKKKPLGRLVFLGDKQLFFIFKDNGFSKLVWRI